MTVRLLLIGGVLSVAVLLVGCAPNLSTVQRAALDRTAADLDHQLTPAGQLAATAALIYDERGAFPATPFELLGSPQSAATGALHLNLSAIEVEPVGRALRVHYILLPTQADPTDRMGTLTIDPAAEDGQFEADVALLRRDDPDHTGRPLFLVQEGQFGVTRLSGRFCIDLITVRQQTAVGDAGDLPLRDRHYRITFTPSPGVVGGFPPDLAAGYTVTIGE